MRIAMIVAAAENGVIGRNNALPWHLPEDLKYFRRTTMGKPIIMGRKTYESIGKPLPGRHNIVVTRNPEWQADGVLAVTSLEEALARAEDFGLIEGCEEALVIGGAALYALALPLVERLYFTQVHAQVAGDAYLPPLDLAGWRELSRERHAADGPNPYDYSFVVYERDGVV